MLHWLISESCSEHQSSENSRVLESWQENLSRFCHIYSQFLWPIFIIPRIELNTTLFRQSRCRVMTKLFLHETCFEYIKYVNRDNQKSCWFSNRKGFLSGEQICQELFSKRFAVFLDRYVFIQVLGIELRVTSSLYLVIAHLAHMSSNSNSMKGSWLR